METKASFVYCKAVQRGELMQTIGMRWAALVLFAVGNFGCIARESPQTESEPNQSIIKTKSSALIDGVFAYVAGREASVDGGGGKIPLHGDLEPLGIVGTERVV